MSFKQDHFSFSRKLFFRFTRQSMSEETWSNWTMARWLGGGDVRNPRSFNEKLHWLRINYHNELLRDLADKWLVRGFVHDRLGDQYLNELYTVWDRAEDVELSHLPDRFVIKCTHGSGMNILIKDKSKTDLNALKRQLAAWQAQDFSRLGREWVYTGRPRKIIAERYLTNAFGMIPEDYKIFCFNGKPLIIQVDLDRFGAHTRSLYNIYWQRLPFEYLHQAPNFEVPRPVNLSEMLYAAQELSRDLPFVRVDFYALPALVFGEMTFFPGGGTEPFRPAEWDMKLGGWLELPNSVGYEAPSAL